MLVAATHTHTAPSVIGALGTGVDRGYADRLPSRITESVVAAAQNLTPARIGWTVAVDSQHTQLPALDLPPGPYCYRSVWRAFDPSDDASGLSESRFHRARWTGGPGLTVLAVQRPTVSRWPCWPITRCTTLVRRPFPPTTSVVSASVCNSW